MKTVYNAIGSRLRNGRSANNSKPHRYGFMADMRLRFNERARQFFQRNIGSQSPYYLNGATHRAIFREFYRVRRTYNVVYYGTTYQLNVCHPYVVVTSASGRVVGVMPI